MSVLWVSSSLTARCTAVSEEAQAASTT
jgi:hypothetical protein